MAAVLWLAACPAPAHAAPKSIADCERIAQADAYNACLAAFGPTAHRGKLGKAPPHRLRGRAAAGPRRAQQRRGVVVERRGDRVRATIDLKRK